MQPIDPRQPNRANTPDMIISGTLKGVEKNTGDAAKVLKEIAPGIKETVKRSGDAVKFLNSLLENLKGDTGETGKTGAQGEPGYSPTPEDVLPLLIPYIPAPIMGLPGRDGADGVSPPVEEIVRQVIPLLPEPPKNGIDGLPGLNGSPDSGSEIVDKINEIDSDGPQIDASHIKNLPRAVTNITRGGIQGVGLLDTLITNPTQGQTLVFNQTTGKWENGAGSGGGGTTTITILYMPDSTTEGSWRISVIGTDLVFSRLESSVWVPKGGATA